LHCEVKKTLREMAKAIYYCFMAEKRNHIGEKTNPPIAEEATKHCLACHYFDYGTCHKEKRQVAPDSTCVSWEIRHEIDGLTVWEVLAREG
jgi:hypothetical protein